MKVTSLRSPIGKPLALRSTLVKHTNPLPRTHVWRRVLELLHDSLVGETPADTEPDRDDDHIVGRYAYITSPLWGKCKCYYEQAGDGDQEILFLHTAGSDSRQYHGVMNDERMLKKCKMTAVELRANGRSFPYQGYWPGEFKFKLLHVYIVKGKIGLIPSSQAATPTPKTATSASSRRP